MLMKTKLVAAALLAATASTVAFYPSYQATQANKTSISDTIPLSQTGSDAVSNTLVVNACDRRCIGRGGRAYPHQAISNLYLLAEKAGCCPPHSKRVL